MEQKNRQTERNLTTMESAAAQEREIDLIELFFALLHNWKSLLLAFLIGAALLAAYHTFFVKPTYKATTEMYITNTDSVISIQDLQVGSMLADDYVTIITSRSVLNKVIQNLNLETNYKALGRLISVSNPTGTHIIRTSVTTTDLVTSRDIANELLNVSIDQIYQIIGTGVPTVIDSSEAEAVENVTPGLLRYIAIGGLLGAFVVAAFVILRILMDTSMKSDDDVEKYLHLPVLSAVPYFKE